MSTLKELISQRDALEQQIAAARKAETSDAIQKIRALVNEYHLSVRDVFGIRGPTPVKTTSKVAAKYRDAVTGQEWSGRGLAPKWLQGKDKTQFLIAK